MRVLMLQCAYQEVGRWCLHSCRPDGEKQWANVQLHGGQMQLQKSM
jgi:hypothetical protein